MAAVSRAVGLADPNVHRVQRTRRAVLGREVGSGRPQQAGSLITAQQEGRRGLPFKTSFQVPSQGVSPLSLVVSKEKLGSPESRLGQVNLGLSRSARLAAQTRRAAQACVCSHGAVLCLLPKART